LNCEELTHEDLLYYTSYDPINGGLIWRRKKARANSGDRVGGFDLDGYVTTGINGKKYRVARLVWFYIHKEWPQGHIDHIDRNKSNDRIENLRVVTIKENNINRASSKQQRKLNLPKWVTPHGKKYRSCVRANGKIHKFGPFDTPEEAHDVAANFAKKHHGEFFNDGK